MIIRHISIPGTSLNQPQQQELDTDQLLRQSRHNHRILNPEKPNYDTLTSLSPTQQNNVTYSRKPSEQSSSSRKDEGLAVQTPQKLDILQNRSKNLSQLPKPQAQSRHNKYEQASHRPIIAARQTTLTPKLIRLNNHSFSLRSNSTNNKLTNADNYGQEEQQTLKKNAHAFDNRLRAPNSTGELIFGKYSFRPPQAQLNNLKNPYSAYNTRNLMPLDLGQPLGAANTKQILNSRLSSIKNILNKRTKPLQITIGLAKPAKIRKMLPSQSDIDEDSLAFTTTSHKTKYSKPRQSQQEESNINPKPESQIQLSNKKIRNISSNYQSGSKQNSIQISYKTSLQQLKQICLIEHLSPGDVTMKIPEIFAYPLFSGKQSQQQLFEKVDQVFKHLQIDANTQKSIKKYANCIVVLTGNVGLIWHFEGKVFLGGWKNEFLDEGCKHGLGLQWKPKNYVYYGQFARNKKEGIGIMKTQKNQLLAGLWQDNHYLNSLSNESDRHVHSVKPIVSHFAFEESS